MKKFVFPLLFVSAFLSAQVRLPQLNEAMKGTSVAILAVDTDGNVIAEMNSDRLMTPASNMKLITTGAALHKLGGDFRFKTKIAYSGKMEGNAVEGDVLIIGEADPCLGSSDSIATPIQNVFGQWKTILNNAGIRHIHGHIVGDGRYIDGMRESQTWEWEDLGTYYGTGMSGLSFCENYFKLRVQPGSKVGDPLQITPGYPSVPGLEIKYECCTGEKNTGDRLFLFTSDFARKSILRGTFALGKSPKSIKCSNKFPEYTCAAEFSKYLTGCTLPNEGPSAELPEGPVTVIGQTDSPLLKDIARFCNYDSNNFYAETFFRTLGKKMTGSACYDSSSVAIFKVIEELGISTKGMRIDDGSGLSRENLISPEFMCRFLGAMMDSPSFDDFYASIPVAGVNGTVRGRLGRLPDDVRHNVRMKSGSMYGVLCFSGYYKPENGKTIIFSVMIGNSTAPDTVLYNWADEAISAIIR